MYKSIRKLLNTPIVLHPFIKRTGTGVKTFGVDITTIKVYPVSEIVVVKTPEGKEITSNTQLYVDENCPAKALDEVTLDGVREEVVTVGTFRSDKGQIEIRILYL